MENKKFLVTENLESVAMLKKMGFQLIDETDGRYTFLNNKIIAFHNLDGVAATDILAF